MGGTDKDGRKEGDQKARDVRKEQEGRMTGVDDRRMDNGGEELAAAIEMATDNTDVGEVKNHGREKGTVAHLEGDVLEHHRIRTRSQRSEKEEGKERKKLEIAIELRANALVLRPTPCERCERLKHPCLMDMQREGPVCFVCWFMKQGCSFSSLLIVKEEASPLRENHSKSSNPPSLIV